MFGRSYSPGWLQLFVQILNKIKRVIAVLRDFPYYIFYTTFVVYDMIKTVYYKTKYVVRSKHSVHSHAT